MQLVPICEEEDEEEDGVMMLMMMMMKKKKTIRKKRRKRRKRRRKKKKEDDDADDDDDEKTGVDDAFENRLCLNIIHHSCIFPPIHLSRVKAGMRCNGSLEASS